MNKKMQAKYPSDLTDEEWEEIRPLFKGMRNRKWSKRELRTCLHKVHGVTKSPE